MTKTFEDIIKNCYLKILKRQPDQIGLKHYLELFKKEEITEEEIIVLMKNSEEYKDIESMENFIKKYDLLFTNTHTEKKLKELAKTGDKNKLISNFFWYGKDFGFLNNIVIKSHIKVGYHPKIWISGEMPSNEYWNDIESKVTIIDITKYFDVEEFLSFGGNLRIASDLWRFHFLYACGGFYSDMDNFILKHFPNDTWIICSGEKGLLSIGFIKCPPKSPVFIECIKNLKIHWGGVQVFTDAYRKVFENTTPTHDSKLFYPYYWKNALKLFKKIKIQEDTYAIHFYQGRLEHKLGSEYKNINKKWCEENPKTVLGQLWKLVK